MAENEKVETSIQPQEDQDGKPVPYHRFSRVIEEKNILSTRVTALSAELDALKGTMATERESWNQEKSLMESGLTDPEGRDIARYLYSRLGEDRPKSIATWLTTLKADGATVPKALAPYLGASPAPTASGTGVAPATPQSGQAGTGQAPMGQAMPRVAATGPVAPPASPGVTAESIRALREEAMRTGDWSKVRAAMPAIRETIASKRK